MSLKKALTYIGKNIKPYWPTVAVASAELIFRPLFTMMDKKSPEETKKYTALREATTEIIAAPTYLALPILASKASNMLNIKDAKKAKMAKHNLQIIGTWTAALFVIPGLCSAVVKPFTEKIYNKKHQDEKPKFDMNYPRKDVSTRVKPVEHKLRSVYSGRSYYQNSGMKVGD